MPQTPIGQFQVAFKLPHLNATFPSTFQIYKHQKHLKKVRAPTRTAVVVVVVATTSRELKEERRVHLLKYACLLTSVTVNFSLLLYNNQHSV